MKTPALLPVIILFTVMFLQGCCELFPKSERCSPDPPKLDYHAAILTIQEFRERMIDQASNNAVGVRSIQYAGPGEVWILNNCDNSIQNLATTVSKLFPENTYEMNSYPVNNLSMSFDWKNSWSDEHNISLDIKYELLELILKASASNSEVHSISFSISLTDTKVERLDSPSILLSDYENHLANTGIKALGNVLITAAIKGKLKISYLAKDESESEVELDLSAKINEVLQSKGMNPGYKFFQPKSDSAVFSVMEESGENLTVFAVEYFPLDDQLVDLARISDIISEDCDNDGIYPQIRIVHGYCSSSGKNLLDLTLEPGVSSDSWYSSWTNNSDQEITSFKYNLTVRNRFGQILGRINPLMVDNIAPGATLTSREITKMEFGIGYSGDFYELYDVELELELNEVSSGLNDICASD